MTALLALKVKLKDLTGEEAAPAKKGGKDVGGAKGKEGGKAPSKGPAPNKAEVESLEKEIKDQGDKVRQLKTSGAEKVHIDQSSFVKCGHVASCGHVTWPYLVVVI